MKKGILSLAIIGIILTSCDKRTSSGDYLEEEYSIISQDLDLPQEVYNYAPEIPEGLIMMMPDLEKKDKSDPTINHQATLGRVLFYDKRLSKNNKTACASCHLQKNAFADNERISQGFEGKIGTRNSLALGTTIGFETSYGGDEGFGSSAFFSWDDSVFDLTEQSRLAITSDIEMGMEMHEVVEKLKDDMAYGILFKNAFGTSQVNEENLLQGLRSFVNSLASTHSKFDEGLTTADGSAFNNFSNFTTEENRGKDLFNNKCASCHGEFHSFTMQSSANNGLDLVYEDKGKGAKFGWEGDDGVFKVPFLRNIGLSAPYMHDGRFGTLEEVIDHYSTGIKPHRNLAFQLRTEQWGEPVEAVRFDFTQSEKNDLISYLHTLTDETFITDVRFSDPFN